MRRILAIFTAALSLCILASCEGAPGMDGRDGRDGVGVIDNIIINVPQKSWQYAGANDNNFFYATVPMKEITEDVFDGGLVKVYRTYNYDSADATQAELPFVLLKEESVDGGKVFYTETVDYEFGIGSITFYYTVSDFIYEYDPGFVPEAMQFRCVVMF